jgi:membrane protein involved in colicin uptake
MNKSDLLHKEQENKRKGFVISLIIHIVIFLFFFIRIMSVPELPESGGILLAFGEPDAGMDTEMPVNADESEASSTKVSSQSAENEPEVISKEKDDLAPVKAKDNDKTKKPAEKKPEVVKKDTKAAAEAKNKAESDKKAKETADKKAADELAMANQKKKYSDMLGKGKGSNSTSGNQGSEKGTPDGKALEGISKGSGRVGGGLTGRGVEYEPSFSDNSQKTGKVSLSICVNSEGKVSKAEFTQKGSTTSDVYLIEIARKSAMKYRFSKSEIDSQCGTVTIDFKVQ